MLDIPTYRMYQELAKSQMPSWRLYQRHSVEFFFLSMLPQLRSMLDALHEGRFNRFMKEMGGLAEEDLNIFLDVCKDTIAFQRIHFPNFDPIVPLNNLIATLCIYRKIKALNPDFSSLLEIGPGCGYMPFFLKNNHAVLENYTQIEAAESFYLLQNYIDEYLYGNRFAQHVYPNDFKLGDFHGAEIYNLNSESAERMDTITIDLPMESKIVHQYPWWQLGQLMSSEEKYEIIMSNANLMEFTPVALKDYLALIYAKLSSNGMLFVQCFGGGAWGSVEKVPDIIETLYKFGFAPLFLALKDEGLAKCSPQWRNHDNYLNITKSDPRSFALSNAVFISRKHDLYKEYFNYDNFQDFFFAPLPNIREAFFEDIRKNKIYTKQQVIELIKKIVIRDSEKN